ncbi:MAG: retropepsin-like aspartic protease [Cyanobacteria bacterium P01_G01_bin.39]
MKKLFTITLWTIIFNAVAISVQAQSGSSCFMLDGNGNPIDLSHLCQNSNSTRRSNRRFSPSVQSTNKYPQKTGVQIVQIKSRRSGIPVIDVKFNEKYVFEMMLDTGASGVVITQQMANKLQVNHTDYVWVSTPSSNYFRMPTGHVYSIGVGKLKQKSPRVITSPSLDMGLLGQSFFGNYDITIKSDTVEFRAR